MPHARETGRGGLSPPAATDDVRRCAVPIWAGLVEDEDRRPIIGAHAMRCALIVCRVPTHPGRELVRGLQVLLFYGELASNDVNDMTF